MKEQLLIIAAVGVFAIFLIMFARIMHLKREVEYLESVLFDNKEKI